MSVYCTRADEVQKVLAQVHAGEVVNGHRTPQNDALMESRLANVNGETAATRIVDLLMTLDAPTASAITVGISGHMMTANTWLLRFVNRMFRLETRSMRKFPGFTLREVGQILDDLTMVTDRYGNCVIKHCFGDVFVVEEK